MREGLGFFIFRFDSFSEFHIISYGLLKTYVFELLIARHCKFVNLVKLLVT
jgi:hypothetical protein